MESRVNIARAFSSKRKEDIIWIGVMLRVVSVLSVASYLSSLRVSSLVGSTGRCKYKVTKEGSVRSVKERNENIRAFAGGSKQRAGAIGRLTFMNDGCIFLERIPMMNVRGRLGQFI
jgi:hypothetical protein